MTISPSLVNAHGGVFTLFHLPSLPPSVSAILLSPFEFPPSSQRTRGRTGNQEGEVSAPPFSCLALHARPFRLSLRLPLPCQPGGALTSHLSLREGSCEEPGGDAALPSRGCSPCFRGGHRSRVRNRNHPRGKSRIFHQGVPAVAMSFEQTCRGCRRRRASRGTFHCPHPESKRRVRHSCGMTLGGKRTSMLG